MLIDVKILLGCVLAVGLSVGWAAEDVLIRERETLYRTPEWRDTTEYAVAGLRSGYYQSLPCRGRPVWVYAYLGVPEGTPPPEGWPGIVLVHGGGGTAFADHVKWWNRHGFAAVAMDLYGLRPDLSRHWQQREHFENSGPSFDFYWESYREPAADQWFAQAGAQVMCAHSLLRAQPGVDPDRIGVVGVSWGGVLTCMVAGCDDRFAFAIAVYGCGGLAGSDGAFGRALAAMVPEQRDWVIREYDGVRHLRNAAMPIFFVNGTNDEHFPPDAWQRSRDAAGEKGRGYLEIRMVHGHQGAIQPMVLAFAESAVGRTAALPQVTAVDWDGGRLVADYRSALPLRKTELLYTRDSGAHARRNWIVVPAVVAGEKITAEIPDGTTAAILNLTDEAGRVVSSPYHEF